MNLFCFTFCILMVRFFDSFFVMFFSIFLFWFFTGFYLSIWADSGYFVGWMLFFLDFCCSCYGLFVGSYCPCFVDSLILV